MPQQTLAMQSGYIFEQLFTSRNEFITERVLFRRCVQGVGTSVQTYLANLREKSQRCGFGSLEDEMIADQFLAGCTSNRLRERLCAEQDLTLTRLEEMTTAADLTAERHRTVGSRPVLEEAKETFQEIAATSAGWMSPQSQVQNSPQVMTCFFCDGSSP